MSNWNPVNWRKASAAFVISISCCTCASAKDKSFGMWGGSGQPCAIVSIDEQSDYRRERTLSIRPFSASGIEPEEAAAFDEVRRKLAATLAEHLGKSRFFRSVAAVPEGERATTDYVLDGVFLAVRRGNVALRFAFAGGAGDARIRLSLSLLAAPEYTRRVAAIDCDTARAVRVSSFFTPTRMAGGTREAKMNQVAESLAKQFEIAEETVKISSVGKAPKSLTGKSEDPNRTGIFGKMRKVAVAAPKAVPLPRKSGEPRSEAVTEAESPGSEPGAGKAGQAEEDDTDTTVTADIKALRRKFTGFRVMANSGRKGPRRVEAVWVTSQAYEAFHRLLADEASAVTPAAQHELRRGMLASKSPLESAAGAGLIVFLVSYEKISWFGPILWNFPQIESSIRLRDPEKNRTLRPKIVLNQPSAPCVREGTYLSTRTLLIGFPPKSDDGESWVGGRGTLELTAEIEGVPIALRFNLEHAGSANGEGLLLKN